MKPKYIPNPLDPNSLFSKEEMNQINRDYKRAIFGIYFCIGIIASSLLLTIYLLIK